MDFSNSCSYCRRIMVDWEDKGLVDLLDMAHVLCSYGMEEGAQIIDIRNCEDCPDAAVISDEDMTEEDIAEWLKWSIFGRFNLGETETTACEQPCFEGCEEREAGMCELPEEWPTGPGTEGYGG